MHVHTDTLAYTLTCTHARLTLTFPHSQSHRHTLKHILAQLAHTLTFTHSCTCTQCSHSHALTLAHARSCAVASSVEPVTGFAGPAGSGAAAASRTCVPGSGLAGGSAAASVCVDGAGPGNPPHSANEPRFSALLFSCKFPVPLPVKDLVGSLHPRGWGPSHLTSLF